MANVVLRCYVRKSAQQLPGKKRMPGLILLRDVEGRGKEGKEGSEEGQRRQEVS